MTKKDNRANDYKRLCKKIHEASVLYYNSGTSKITDAEFDAMVKARQALADELGIEVESVVGAVIENKSEGKRHWTPMLSLKTFSYDQTSDVGKWWDKLYAQRPMLCMVTEPKYDGLALSLTYKSSRLARALTRGDGHLGQDVLLNALNVLGIPHMLNDDVEFMEIRGEVIIEKANWTRQAKITGRLRNIAAGAMMGKSEKEVIARWLRFIPYDMVKFVPGKNARHSAPINHIQAMELAIRLGFHIPPEGMPNELEWARGFNDAANAHAGAEMRANQFPTEVDGLVVKVNDFQEREKLGSTESSPNWACAWKFPPEMECAVLARVDWRVSGNGSVSPVGILRDPINLGGTKVSQLTLHDPQFIARHDIREGDFIHVELAGDVIPKFSSVTTDSKINPQRGRPYQKPTHCPACQSKLSHKGAKLRCEAGMACHPQALITFQKWVQKDAMGMPVFDKLLLGTLLTLPDVKDVADLYTLNYDNLVEMGVISKSKLERVQTQLEASKEKFLQNVLLGLNIPGMNKAYSKLLERERRDLSGILEAKKRGPILGPNSVNKKLCDWLDSAYAVQLIPKLIALGF